MRYSIFFVALAAIMVPTMAHAEAISISLLATAGLTLEAGSAAAAAATFVLGVPIGGAIALIRRLARS
jgi:hypothetical protein